MFLEGNISKKQLKAKNKEYGTKNEFSGRNAPCDGNIP